MYLPPHFEETRQSQIEGLIEAFPLATLTCVVAGDIVANHIPMLLKNEQLIGHIAYNNDLHRMLEDHSRVLVIFRGEDSYISPNWYPTKQDHHKHVPTWNYQVVHIEGRMTFQHDDKSKRAIVGQLTRHHEARTNGDRAWKMADAPKSFMDSKLAEIVGFRILIDRVIAKSKVSQNREAVDFENVAREMDRTDHRHLAEAMQGHDMSGHQKT